jgi:uncharacterized protein (TIGR03083 family)
MLELDGGRFAALRDLDATLSRLRSLEAEDWQRSTPCAGWDLQDLARHLGETTQRLATAFSEIVARRTGPAPGFDELPEEHPDDPHLAALAHATVGRNHFATATALLAPEDADAVADDCQPSRTGARLITTAALEFGLHRYDVEVALGEESGLTEEAVYAADAIFGAALVRRATASGERPDAPLRYELRGDRVDRALTWTGTEWTAEATADGPVTRISGDDGPLMLFLCGRIPATDAALTIDGDDDAAARFKTYVPGP